MKALGPEGPGLQGFFCFGGGMDLTKMMLNLALGGGTWVLGLLIILSIASVAVMLERAWTFYRGRFGEEAFISEIEPLLAASAWSDAAARCETTPGFEPQVLLAGLCQVQRGRAAVEETMEAERTTWGSFWKNVSAFWAPWGPTPPSSASSGRCWASSMPLKTWP
jgi:biopolymer transport protein ExbB